MSEVTSEYRKHKIYSGSVDVIAEETFGKVEALLNGIPGGVYKAVGSALTRAADAGKTEAKRAVSKEYTIGSGDFLRYTRNINHFVRSGDGSVEVEFGFAGYNIPLLHFQVSIDREFRLDVRAGIEYLVYPDNIYPFYAGEMISTWRLPPVEREVIYGKQGYSNIRQVGPDGHDCDGGHYGPQEQ